MAASVKKTAEQIRADVCGDKVRHAGPRDARMHAVRLGRPLAPYRCPFCQKWHVGHPPSVEGMKAIARVIRGLAPYPEDEPSSKSTPRRRVRRRCTGAPDCPNPAGPGGKCTDHARTIDATRNARRVRSIEVYRSKRWRRLRRLVLTEEPYCQHPGCPRPASDVDHITRVEDDPIRAFDRSNLQALCHSHHSSKTARETGFGRSNR